jgi:2-C-methyl-D-erythritol 4-phosphate cytidylyltransferase
VWAVVVGGGSGRRFGRAKQYESLGRERVIDRSVRVAAEVCHGVVVVVPESDVEAEAATFAGAGGGTGPGGVPIAVVAGGDTRTASVRAGLSGVPDHADIVCVHDAARPLAPAALYRRVIDAVWSGADAAVPGIAVTDTIKVVDTDGRVIDTPARASLTAVQTPQAFRADVLRAAHTAHHVAHQAGAGDPSLTDDAMLVERRGGVVLVVAGETTNRKITEPSDLDWARAIAGDTC